MELSQINGHDSAEFMLITDINQDKNILFLIHKVRASFTILSVVRLPGFTCYIK